MIFQAKCQRSKRVLAVERTLSVSWQAHMGLSSSRTARTWPALLIATAGRRADTSAPRVNEHSYICHYTHNTLHQSIHSFMQSSLRLMSSTKFGLLLFLVLVRQPGGKPCTGGPTTGFCRLCTYEPYLSRIRVVPSWHYWAFWENGPFPWQPSPKYEKLKKYNISGSRWRILTILVSKHMF